MSSLSEIGTSRLRSIAEAAGGVEEAMAALDAAARNLGGYAGLLSHLDAVRQGQASPAKMGPLTNRLLELRELKASLQGIEHVAFQGTLGSTGVVTAPANIKLQGDFFFYCYKFRGWMQQPAVNSLNLSLITWNIRESGAKTDIFTSDVNMSSMMADLGPGEFSYYPGGYIFTPGADLKLTFKIATGWSGGNKEVGVALLGEVVRA